MSDDSNSDVSSSDSSHSAYWQPPPNVTSDVAMAAPHPLLPQASIKFAPTDGSQKFNTIRVVPKPVACWRLNDPAFAFDSSFVGPNFRDELGTLSRIVAANPGCPAALFGHCDPAGSDALNKTLGDRRAIAVYALLTRQPDLWAYLYDKSQVGDTWDLHMVQTMLASVADGQGNPYYAGEADGIKGSETKDAVKRFQGDAGLSADGDPGPQTRRALFGVYMDWLCTPASAYAQPNDPNQAAPSPLHMQSADFLGGAGAQPGDLPQMSLQSCGKFNPVVLLEKSEMNETDKTERNEDDAPNRRVVMFFFAKGTTIDPAGWPCPKVKDENNACKAAFWPDGDQRRQNGDARRTYQRAHDTMACRFYDRWARRSPCEGGLARQSADFFVYPAAQDGSSAGSQLEASWGDALRLGWLIGGSVQTLTISNDAVGASADVTGYSQTKGGYTVGNVPVVVPPDAVEVGTATYKLAVNRATGSVNLRVHVRISGVAPDPPTWALAPLVGVDEADDLGLGAPEPICPWPCSPDEGDGDS